MADNTQNTTATIPQIPGMVMMSQEQFDALMSRVSVVDRIVTALAGGEVKKNGRGGRHKAQPVLDTKTGIAYRTKAEAGKTVAPEFGLKVHNFVWYELVKGTKENPAKCPDRFQELTDEQYAEYLELQAKTKEPVQPAKVEPVKPEQAKQPVATK